MSLNRPSEILLRHCRLVMQPDGIIMTYGTDHTYSVADIIEINNAVGKMTGNQKALLLFVASRYSEVDSDARTYMSTPDATIYSRAEAYVIKSLAQRLIINFVIKVGGTAVPVRFFTDMEPAVKWLLSFENKTSSGKKDKTQTSLV